MTSWNVTMLDGQVQSITVFAGEEPLVASREHPRFDHIQERLNTQPPPTEEEMRDLFDISFGIGKRFERLSERITVRAGKLYFDGDLMDSNLTTAIIRYHEATDGSFQPLVNLLEKLMTNPQEHSRKELYGWLARHSYQICDDGDFIAYKSVHDNGDGTYRSDSRGEAIVDGEEFEGQIPQYPGAIVEMPRSVVRHDPGQACSKGLHIASWTFASSFLRDSDAIVLRVKVNPRDVVNVPTGDGSSKMRTCRYTVLGPGMQEHDSVVPTPAEQTIPAPPTDAIEKIAAAAKKAGSEFTKKAAAEPKRKEATTKAPSKVAAKKVAPKKPAAKAAPKASKSAKKAAAPKVAPALRPNDPLPQHAFRGKRCQCGVELEGDVRRIQRESHLAHKAKVLGL